MYVGPIQACRGICSLDTVAALVVSAANKLCTDSILEQIQVRNLERSYFKMWNLYCLGGHPQPFKVVENDVEFPFDR